MRDRTEAEKDAIVEQAEHLCRKAAKVPQDDNTHLVNPIDLQELRDLLSPSPLPTDVELRALVFAPNDGDAMASVGEFTVCDHDLRALYADALGVAANKAKQRANEPGWQLEDFAVELADLVDEMESR